MASIFLLSSHPAWVGLDRKEGESPGLSKVLGGLLAASPRTLPTPAPHFPSPALSPASSPLQHPAHPGFDGLSRSGPLSSLMLAGSVPAVPSTRRTADGTCSPHLVSGGPSHLILTRLQLNHRKCERFFLSWSHGRMCGASVSPASWPFCNSSSRPAWLDCSDHTDAGVPAGLLRPCLGGASAAEGTEEAPSKHC